MVVSSTTLQPDKRTVLTMPLLMGMHQGMGGVHLLAVDVRSNDSLEPVQTLRWRFDVTDVER